MPSFNTFNLMSFTAITQRCPGHLHADKTKEVFSPSPALPIKAKWQRRTAREATKGNGVYFQTQVARFNYELGKMYLRAINDRHASSCRRGGVTTAVSLAARSLCKESQLKDSLQVTSHEMNRSTQPVPPRHKRNSELTFFFFK